MIAMQRWCLTESNVLQVVDCGSVIAHIFDGQEARAQYDLDSLWAAPPATGLEREPAGSSSHAVQSMS
jgi:hypothetical protein